MKKRIWPGLCLAVVLGFAGVLPAQTPSDDLMMKKGEICIALMYDDGAWDEYWEGPTLRTNANIGTLSRNTLGPMIAYGIIDKLNMHVGAAYVQTEASGGQQTGVEGIQDLSLSLKYEFFNKQAGKGKVSFLSTLGFSTPLTNYLSDYMPFSLGFGAPELNLRGILQYRLDNGIYVRGALAHLWRGQTEVERDYYYNNGSYYTNLMDVPNAWNYNAVAGVWLFGNSLKLEASYMGLKSTSGDDIRKYNAPQPTNKVEVEQAGFFAQYYFKKIKGLGVLAYYSQMINGRNMGKFTNLGFGLTYQFKIFNKNQN